MTDGEIAVKLGASAPYGVRGNPQGWTSTYLGGSTYGRKYISDRTRRIAA